MKNLGRKNKKRGDWPRFAWFGSWQKPASAGYRLFPSKTKKKPLDPCGVVRGVITKVPFSLLLGAESRNSIRCPCEPIGCRVLRFPTKKARR
jgi:hypothetical protein